MGARKKKCNYSDEFFTLNVKLDPVEKFSERVGIADCFPSFLSPSRWLVALKNLLGCTTVGWADTGRGNWLKLLPPPLTAWYEPVSNQHTT